MILPAETQNPVNREPRRRLNSGAMSKELNLVAVSRTLLGSHSDVTTPL
jgi:hypothetical protein